MKDIKKSQRRKPIIYIVDSSIGITGAFVCARNEAKLLRDEIDTVIVLSSSTQIKKEDLIDFKKVVYLPIMNIRKSFKRIIIYLPALMYSSWKLKRYMKDDDCENLQLNDFYLMHGVFSRFFGFKGNIVTWVRINPRKYGSFLSKIWLKLGYKYSNNIVAVSHFILDLLPDSKKNRLIYDPVYIRDFSEQKHDNRLVDETRNLIYIGNYIEGKGQQYAIEAFIQVAEKYPDVQLHFYGGDMGMDKNRAFRQRLKDQAAATPYVNRIYFHGFVDDVRFVFQDAYAALNFSDSESFSLSCLEASYYGVPLVATRSGGPQEIIEHKVTGLLVDISDVDMMSDAIEKLLKDEILAKEMGEKATIYVKRKFSDKQFKQEIIDVFKLK